MGLSKIQSEDEVRRWYEEGRTYAWMADEYMRKYRMEVSPSMFSQIRRRMGWESRQVRDDSLVPWGVKPEHRWSAALQMLRAEARVRAGKSTSQLAEARVSVWKETLERENAVVHYEPDTDEGFFYVPREEGDDDLIRRPEAVTRQRKVVE